MSPLTNQSPQVIVLPLLLCIFASASSAQDFSPDVASDRSLLLMDGYTEPYRDIKIGSPDTGTIAAFRVEAGQSIRFGQVIAKLDDAVVRANVEVARNAAASTGELDAARITLSTGERKYMQTLALHGRNHATEQELWQAQSTRDEATARVKAYEEVASRRRLELAQAETYLQRMTITSPLDGIVIEMLKDVGEIVSPADPHLVRVVQLDPLRVSATATGLQAKSLKPGQSLRTTIDGEKHFAVVEFISPVIDAGSGNVIIHLRLPNPNRELSAGQACQISLAPSRGRDAPANENQPRQTLRTLAPSAPWQR